MVRWLSREKKLQTIRMVTNGLAKPLEYYERLFEYGLSRLEISVDSLSQQTATLIRTGTRVEILKRLISSLCQKHSDKIKIRTTVSKVNAPSMNDLLSSLEKLGVRQVVLQPLESRQINPNVLSLAGREGFKEKVRLNIIKYPKIDIDYHFFESSTGRCNVPFRSPNITVDGHMTPCCNIPFKEDLDYGCLIHSEFDSVWNSECAVEFRKEMKHGFPAMCEACTNKKRSDMMFLEAEQSVKPH
jgi:MoaA/NifB/PqqE/SkfB family radical SAM enzyme